MPQLESESEPLLGHDSSTNNLNRVSNYIQLN
jgi:hypothetical protein